MADYIIEIDAENASACRADGEAINAADDGFPDWADCTASGDVEEACRFMLAQYDIDVRTVAVNAAGEYENRLATDAEMIATCEAIYFESETDFSQNDWARVYLVWQAASDLIHSAGEAQCEA